MGHLFGDNILKKITKTIRLNTRKNDCVCRYGGEEFCVVIDNCDHNLAVKLAERIRTKIEQLNITISIGGYVVNQQSSANKTIEQSIDEAIGIADNNLYFAKRNGKNQVCL